MSYIKQAQGFSGKIVRIYLLGASVLLAFYTYTFHAGIMITENSLMERRIGIVAPFHFKRFELGETGVLVIDPLLTLYDRHARLPWHIQSKMLPNWTGSQHLMLDDEREFQVVAQQVDINNRPVVVYAVEEANPVEWDDTSLVLFEVILVLIGILLFLTTVVYMIKAARRIAMPFQQVAEQLKNDPLSNFEQIVPCGEKTLELQQMVLALNSYRARLALLIAKEQSFTRYVSHELRTPMMVIKGTVSNLRRGFLDDNSSKHVEKILKATNQMHVLTDTFLLLARNEALDSETSKVDKYFLRQVYEELEDTIIAGQIEFQWQLKETFELPAHPQLLKAVIHNLLKNSFAYTFKGKVSLLIDNQGIDVIDNGLGLKSEEPKYQGFGIGLVLVEDICGKYAWHFSIANNHQAGCTAKILFKGK